MATFRRQRRIRAPRSHVLRRPRPRRTSLDAQRSPLAAHRSPLGVLRASSRLARNRPTLGPRRPTRDMFLSRARGGAFRFLQHQKDSNPSLQGDLRPISKLGSVRPGLALVLLSQRPAVDARRSTTGARRVALDHVSLQGLARIGRRPPVCARRRRWALSIPGCSLNARHRSFLHGGDIARHSALDARRSTPGARRVPLS